MKNPKHARVAGHTLRYYVEGKGEPVLLVHGITTYSFIWRNIVPRLARKYKVYTVDLLGCGESDKPLDTSYSLKNHSRMVKEFLEVVGEEKVHYVGHDLGGGVGQIFAVNYPEALHDLTLINSVGHDFWPVQPIIAMRTPIIRQFAMATLDLGAFRLIVRHGMYYSEKVTPELMDMFHAPMKSVQGRKAFLHFAHSLDNKDLVGIESSIRQLTIPVHIIRGDGDAYLSGAIAQKLHEDIRGSRLTIIDTAGHFIQEDEPEMVAEAVMAFYEGDCG